MRTQVKPATGSWDRIVRLALRSSGLLALMWISLLPLAGQNDQAKQDDSFQSSGEQADATGVPEYSGPAVLSRASQPGIGQGFELFSIQPFFSVNEFYESGNTPNGSTGLAVIGGLKGSHQWKKVTFSINAQGEYQRYAHQSTILGANQLLDLTAVVPLAHHLTMSFQETAGSLRQDYGTLLLQPQLVATAVPVPTNEPFNTTVKFVNSKWALVYQMSPRLSFSGSVDESLMRGQYLTQLGINSTTVGGDVNYQLTPRTTVGIDYSFSHYGYTTFGSSDFNVAGLDYSWRVTNTVEVAAQLGAAHGSTRSLAYVAIDPGGRSDSGLKYRR